MRRNRLGWAGMGVATMALGLLSRHFRALLPGFLEKNAGDVLWASWVFLLVGLGWPGGWIWRVGVVALGFSFGIEFSQLYHGGWIDAVRPTIPGRLVLGSIFVWGDFVCYGLGVGIGVAVELGVRRW